MSPLLVFHSYDEEKERKNDETYKEEVATKSDFFWVYDKKT